MALKGVNQSAVSCLKGQCPTNVCPARGSPSRSDRLTHLPDQVLEKINNHPCFSEQAHHYYALVHVAVAPACNIQCHYCNRKYDCANESRPGVVSELLDSEQAVRKALAVAAAIPHTSVVGVAGPGDPLANSERTFSTFRGLTEKAPDLKLCVSTNGLALPRYVDELVKHNIGHVTITINCIDPRIGTRIYPWIFWNHRRLRGEKAAEILIEQQLKGLEMLVQRGVLVKVNSVMIPDINDQHLKQVSRVVKDKGAFLHNVVPLIARPEHGTYYGRVGQREPSEAELNSLQEACSGNMTMMRHCRQCRADAVGLLGADRGAEFTLDKLDNMEINHEIATKKRARVHEAIERQRTGLQQAQAKINFPNPQVSSFRSTVAEYPTVRMAVATRGGGVINEHFGQAQEFLIYEASPEGVCFVGYRKVDNYCSGLQSCGDRDTVLRNTIRMLQGCKVVLCAQIGFEPWTQLEAAGILPNGEHAMKPIEEAILEVYRELIENGELSYDDDLHQVLI
jgi:nitrogen fixation protein NifB